MRLSFPAYIALLIFICKGTILYADEPKFEPKNETERRLWNHAIIVDGDGCAMIPVVTGTKERLFYRSKRMESENTGGNRDEFNDYLEKMFKHIAAVKPKRILIYIHGGMNFLNDTQVGLKTIQGSIHHADDLCKQFPDEKTYVISVCWQSDAVATYSDRLFTITNGVRDYFPLRKAAAPIILCSDIISSIARYPETMYNLISNDFISMEPKATSSRFRKAIEAQQTLERAQPTEKDKKPVTSFFAGNERGRTDEAVDITRWIASFPVKLITTPVLNIVGNNAWAMMLRRSRTLFDRESTFLNDDMTKEIGRPGALRMFFNLAATRLECGKIANCEISLIGHSMGAIVGCNILRENCGRKILFDNIVFMAAACTQREFQASVIPYLRYWKESGSRPRFYSLCLNPDAEMAETPLTIPLVNLEIAPRGSLLIWLDGVFDRPSSEGDRMFGRWDNSILYANTIAASGVGDLVTIKTFGRNRNPGATQPRRYIDVPPHGKPQKNPGQWDYGTAPVGPSSPLAKKKKPIAEPTRHGEFSRFDPTEEPTPTAPELPKKAINFKFWDAEFWNPEPNTAVEKPQRQPKNAHPASR